MWALENQTVFSAERLFLRDEQGAEVFVVLVKATLTIAPDGRAQMADDQLPIAIGPKYSASRASRVCSMTPMQC